MSVSADDDGGCAEVVVRVSMGPSTLCHRGEGEEDEFRFVVLVPSKGGYQADRWTLPSGISIIMGALCPRPKEC